MLSDIATKILKKIETDLLQNKLTEKLEIQISYDENTPYTQTSFKEEVEMAVTEPRFSIKSITYPFLIAGAGAGRFAYVKIFFFILFSLLPMLIFWLVPTPSYASYVLIPMTIWMIGFFWSFFELPVNLIIKENNPITIIKVQRFITEHKINDSETLELLKTQLQLLEKVPELKINTFRIALLGFYLLLNFFFSETWKSEKPELSFIILGLVTTGIFYFFVESYVSLKNSTFLLAFTAINNLKAIIYEANKQKSNSLLKENKPLSQETNYDVARAEMNHPQKEKQKSKK